LSRLEKTVGARSVLILLLITVLLRTGLTFGINLLVSEQAFNQTEIYYAFTMLQEIVMFGLPVFAFIYFFRPRYMPVLKKQLAYPAFGAAVRTVLAAVVGAWALQLYISLWSLLLEALNLQMWVQEMPLPENGAQIILALAAVGIVPAVLEELMFRGALLEGLKRELLPKTALILTALLFAFMHGSVTGLPAHVALGLVITLLAIKQNNLQLPMIYHFSHNAASLMISMYFRNAMEGVDLDAQAQALQGASMLPAVLGVLSMALMATFAFWLLIRPLLKTAGAPKAAVVTAEPSIPHRNHRTVILLTALLFLLLLPWYALDFLPV
jgi:membrane protease YdiL (CAAX protease family)